VLANYKELIVDFYLFLYYNLHVE